MVNIDNIKMLKSIKINDTANEEETKNKLIIPFLQALGYSFFNDTIQPEFSIGVGSQKVDRIDYLLTNMNNEKIIVECKRINTNIENYISQLSKYYMYLRSNNIKVKVAIITNGKEFMFFSDNKLANVMDTEPFYTFKISEQLDTQDIMILEKYSYTSMSKDKELEHNKKYELLKQLGLEQHKSLMLIYNYDELISLRLSEKSKLLDELDISGSTKIEWLLKTYEEVEQLYNERINKKRVEKYLNDLGLQEFKILYTKKPEELIELQLIEKIEFLNKAKSYGYDIASLDAYFISDKEEFNQFKLLVEEKYKTEYEAKKKYLSQIGLDSYTFLYKYTISSLKMLNLEEKVDIIKKIESYNCEIDDIQEFLLMDTLQFTEYLEWFKTWINIKKKEKLKKIKKELTDILFICGLIILMLSLFCVLADGKYMG